MVRTTSQLIWNCTSTEHPPINTWYLLIINERRKINEIKQKFAEEVKTTEQERVIAEGKIKGNNLEYEVLEITSSGDWGKNPKTINWNQIYQGNRTRDLELRQKKTLLTYIDKLLEEASPYFEVA